MVLKAITTFTIIAVFTLLPFSQILSAQEDWVSFFQDDFEDGDTDCWKFSDGESLAETWQIEEENGNNILSGSDHTWANICIGNEWTDYSFSIKVKLISGKVHINYRLGNRGRYFIGFGTKVISLNKQIQDDFYSLAEKSISHSFNTWYTIEAEGIGGSIKVYVNDTLLLNYIDENPLLYGGIAFETLDNSHVHFDDVLVVGKPPPDPPSGYTWIRTGGPSGGLGYDVRIDPTNSEIMFVTDNPSGVNKSYDGGDTWVQKNEGITTRAGPSTDGIPIFSLTIDPSNSNIVWAGTQNSKGIYKSVDGGETWEKKDNGVTEGDEISFRGFGIHPQNSNIVFAGAEISTGELGIEFDKTKGKIYKTEDGGENWFSVWEGDNLVRFILFDYDEPHILYASTGIFDREDYNDEGIGILKSTDGGKTWTPINNGIPNSEGNRFPGFLEIHPTNPKILLAASGNNAKGEGGIYRTFDGGQTWEKVLSNDVFSVVTFSPSKPQVIYAGSAIAFYRSEDMGDNWQKFFKEDEDSWGPPGIKAGFPISAVVDPDDPFTLFANNYIGGNFKSIDGAETWSNASKGYTGAHLHGITIDPNHPATVYTIGRSGPFRSYNAGINWEGIGFNPAISTECYAIALNPHNTSEVLISDEFGGHILKSTDGGNSWRQVFKHPEVTAGDPQHTRHGFKAIVYAPSNSKVVYAGMRKGRRSIDGDFPHEPSFGMYKSTDGGETWVEINNGLQTSYINIHCIAIHPTNADIGYIGTWRDGVFKTVDGGESWVLKSNGLISSDVRSLAIDPQDSDIIYAGLGEGGGIFKSDNGGELWSELNTGLNIVCPSYLSPVGKVTLGISLEEPPRRVVGADYYAVPWTSIWDIIVDPTNSQLVYAADHQSGVYLSTDGGNNWVPIREGLSMKAVTALAISSDGEVIYAATEGEGVFRIGTIETTSSTTSSSSTTTTSSSSTTTTVPSACPLELIYGTQSEEMKVLRYIRDNVLKQTPEGKEIIRLYYEWNPVIVRAMEADEEFKEQVKEMVNGVLLLIDSQME